MSSKARAFVKSWGGAAVPLIGLVLFAVVALRGAEIADFLARF